MNRSSILSCLGGVLLITFGSPLPGVSAAEGSGPRPSAVIPAETDDQVLISDANQGRLFRVNVNRRTVVHVLDVGESLVDLAWAADDQIIAIDQDLQQLISFGISNQSHRISKRIALDLDPRRLAVSDDLRLACVSGRWSKSAQVVVWSERNKLVRRRPIALGFEAQEILSLPNHRFLLADAFGGQLAVIDAARNRVSVIKQLHGHNIRGLAISDDGAQVLITHQVLSRVARSDFDDIHWGSLMQNVVSVVPLEALLDPAVEVRTAGQQIQLGDIGNGFADPTGVVSISSGFVAVSGGARQALVFRDGRISRRLPTGGRPTRILPIGGDRIVILNEHDGSLTVATLTSQDSPETIHLGSGKPVTGGERAFYDARLSHDSWLTCNSCHVDGHTPGLAADTFGDGMFGNAKRIPGLLGVKQTRPFGWLGNKANLSQQISATLQSTMHAENLPQAVTDDLVQYVRRLSLPPVAVNQGQALVESGKRVFEKLQCKECHRPPRFTSPLVRDVGVQDEVGNRKFNPPSLRGLRHRRSFLHDARATSLVSVFRDHRHQVPAGLTDQELERLVAYLNTL